MTAAQKRMILQQVKRSCVPKRHALRHIGIARSTYYRWRRAYLRKGIEGLQDDLVGPHRVWNRVTDEERDTVIEQALLHPEEPPRQIAFLVTDRCGFSVSESTVAKYMVRIPKPPSQTWRSFLKNHVAQIAAIDFFTVPTITFRVLYIYLVLRHSRRLVIHFNITTNPTAQWTAQQIVEAFPYDQSPGFILRDRDGTYGELFRERVKHMGIEEVLIAPRAPWQNPFAERIIGSIRRDCLDHVIVLNEGHLHRILSEYFTYYHEARAHLSLERNSPIPRSVQLPERGRVISKAYLGGLHHCYSRAA